MATSAVTTPTPTNTNPMSTAAAAFSPSTTGRLAGQEQTVSSWSAPYVTGMLGKAQALSETPYQTYQGPLTAGESPLQRQAFQGIGSLAAPAAFTPGTFTPGTFGTEQAQQYMNPYLQQALNPAMEEARRQAEISRVGQAGRLTQAGAYGGSRQAIMESELNRNLMQAQNKMLGEGYATAYDKAMAQYNADMARSMEAQRMGEQSRQFGASYGLQGLEAQRQNLAQLLGAGAQQRGIEAEGVAADRAEFEAQRDFPYKQLQFQQSMLQNMPFMAANYAYQEPSGFSDVLTGAGGLMDLYERIFGPKKPGG